MMGHQQVEQAALFYEFSLERHVPADHLLRSIDRFVELDGLRQELSCFYSAIGRPSIAPELMIRRRCIDEGLVGGESFAVDATGRMASRARRGCRHKPQAVPSRSI